MRGTQFAVAAVVVAGGLLLGGTPVAHADDAPVPAASATAAEDPTPVATVDPAPVVDPAPTVDPTTPTTPVSADRTRLPLRFDDRGRLVARAQERLMWLGYELSENSQAKELFGITMRRGVRAFQGKQGLPVTGVIDRRTWRTLEDVAGRVGTLPRRCTEVAKAVCIDKTARVIRLVVDGRVRMTADARFGGPGMETDEGTFRVNSKSYNHVSSRYGSWMPRAMFFNGDEAVHYSPDFAQVGYSRGSHGCVGLRDMEKATWLYERVPVGTRVVVYWS
jgi:hypothetical protein